MTIEKFLEEVSKYEWEDCGPYIRSKEEVCFFYPFEDEGPKYHTLCPLCYIVYKLHGQKLSNNRFDTAGVLLGIDAEKAFDIASVADGHQSTDFQVWLRDQLKKAAHLE